MDKVLFPAYAGMNRPRKIGGFSLFSVPRLRGDEPDQLVTNP